MNCAYCQSQVEDDSFFCDQCGKEIMICMECGRTGQGKCCDEDGSDLVTAKTKSETAAKSLDHQTDNLQNNPVIQSRDPLSQPLSNVNPPQTFSASTQSSKIPGLRLVNSNLGLTMDISSGEILGRTTGPYSAKLSGFPGISGKHLMFQYNSGKGWSFRDIGSSNGTKYNKANKDWQNTAIATVNVDVPVENKTYILIANVEFVIEIENHSNTGTQRL